MRPRVLVVGTGFGGLFATKALAKVAVDVTLVGSTTHHLFQPLLYQVATGILSQGEIAPATREILRRQRNVTVRLGEVIVIDVAAKCVTVRSPIGDEILGYDHLIVAAGAGQSYFGNDAFAAFAPGLKTIDDALQLRGRIFGAFELAEIETDADAVAAWMTFVVVGAGPTGVEMAGQIRELSRRALRRNFRRIDPGTSRVILLDAGPRVLPSFWGRLSEKSQRQIERLGIEVQLNARVVDVDASGIVVEDPSGARRRIASMCKVWAAGVSASPLARQLGAQTGAGIDSSGRIRVEPDLTLPGHPEIFVLGDMVALDGLPGVAQVAMQGGRHAARQIQRMLVGKPTGERFHYFDKGSMATISRFRAIAEVGPIRITGFVAWWMWLVIHLFYLVGFKHRVTTLLHWVVSFLGRGRSERAITAKQTFAADVATTAPEAHCEEQSGKP